jgi:alginate O-acetyltransferase complex protein AlgI
VRYGDLATQLEHPTPGAHAEGLLTGFYRFALGLGKKVLIADVLGSYADAAFGVPSEALEAGTAWLGALAYTLQIYFDFAGYSDMALGLARMLGFELPENFRDPFVSTSVTEFWTRWHVSLSAWMRAYVYVPLGGNRVGRRRHALNLVVVFLLSGLWHGAAWSFVLWGAYHGALLLVERARSYARPRAALGRACTLIAVTLGFVLFRNAGWDVTLRYYAALVKPASGFAVQPTFEFTGTLALALLFAFWATSASGVRVATRVYAERQVLGAHLVLLPASLALYVFCLARVAFSPFNPFLYFRF